MAVRGDKRAPEIGPGMQLLKMAVIVMGVLIIGGTAAVVVVIAHRLSAPHPRASAAAAPAAPRPVPSSPGVPTGLGQPAGSRIVAISRVSNGLALLITGGGEPDRVLVIDPSSGRVLLRIGVAP
ncbi:MAG: DUF6476 family protein [Acetobacteraceae bacterium]